LDIQLRAEVNSQAQLRQQQILQLIYWRCVVEAIKVFRDIHLSCLITPEIFHNL